jgi:hypothetical protein
MVSCGHRHTQFHLIGSMRLQLTTKNKEEIIQRLGEYFADTLVECTDYVHDGTLTAEDVAKMIFDELEDWMAYHASMTNAADAIRNALRERVS